RSPGYGPSAFTQQNGSTFNNLAGATLDMQNSLDWSNNTLDSTFTNAGTLKKSVSTATTQLIVAFNNSGVVQVQSGTLTLTNGGRDSGSFVVAAGATLVFAGLTHTLVAGASETGAGQVNLSNGSLVVTAGADVTVQNLSLINTVFAGVTLMVTG